ncbi:MAG TPA: cysteine desulfurase family protein [Mobilitalea sp.]|nr:cysteine desulfurase family protein [Mobilitalea sp.]
MIYLDYAANTPVDPEVMNCFVEISNKYIANPNSSHLLGREAKEELDRITEHIAGLLGVNASEIIYTSGASEANNLAVKGLVQAYKNNGKHIISTCLEHPSVSGALTYLQTLGYETDLVDITKDGLVDLEHLKELLRNDTVLVSICSVDSELGVRQPVEEIAKLLEAYPNCFFHTDATQAIGKVPVNAKLSDCMTFTPHKFFGLNGCGILVKKDSVVLNPLIHGGTSTTIYRSGTPALGLAASIDKALDISLAHQKDRYDKVKAMNVYLKQRLLGYKKVRINSTDYSIPHILNLSVQGIKGGQFQEALEQECICVSVKSACSVPGSPSRPVYAVSKDKKNAMCSWRISLSYLTTEEELDIFMKAFERCYMKLAV